MKSCKKKILSFTCAVLAAATLFGTVACTPEKEIVNAYDIAVKNGFVGTEEEWLASLQGSDGKDAEKIGVQELYEAALADGFQGSMRDIP